MNIGIDLGTANTLITLGGDIIINEPSAVAYDKKKRRVIAVGIEAYNMIGRTPGNIAAISPLIDGVISDNRMAEFMVKEFIRKTSGNMLTKPQIIMCVPSAVTNVEGRAIVEAALSAGARKVYLIDEPIAALLGAGIDIKKPVGTMIIDIGGGTTDIAVVSFNGVVQAASVKIAGNKFTSAIMKYILQKYKLVIGKHTADEVKRLYTNIFDPNPSVTFPVSGNSTITRLPQKINVSETDIREALSECIDMLLVAIKSVLEKTPPELVGDIHSNGIILTGGGAMLGGLDKFISEKTSVKCTLQDNAPECVAKGIAKAFECTDELLDGFKKISLYRYR